jgi:hypothetical protein
VQIFLSADSLVVRLLTNTTEPCAASMQSSSSHAFVVVNSSSSSRGLRVFKGGLLAVVGAAVEPGCSSVTSQI